MTKKYTVFNNLFNASDTEELWSAKFVIEAKSQSEADTMASKWARYHSFDTRTVKAIITTDQHQLNWETHNEWC